ncbi:aspartate--tRNA ligase [Sedimentibacter saalensis]|jgi:aspartyl-tRNA synthetase|uniref:Aspartate--tRNA ligase n=1 Tax=Sedimentibacter saalensis TaxID=130788 RepID=A0A562J9D8_9FIRM|nr:aspartate--tRNA ligase [Sedimentibacter saalensis]MEA5095744.1 aspartate--tRNA ligase [Sedimentibacter saalensis]TWH79801.1 aspartyl-tRNA synthetase [Sedimentibacter saalensis]
METMGTLRRTNMCGQLNKDHIGKEVVVMGWVQKRRSLGGLIFADVRDVTGLIQVVFDTDVNKEAFDKAESLRSEFVIAVRGEVLERQSKNPDMATGEIEVYAHELKILDTAETPPIYIKDNDDVSEQMRLKYRYLDLRKPSMQKNLLTRSKTSKVIRDFLYDNGFNEVETPFLAKPTPEGARDYLVPSRVNPGNFYALPQSPQLYKQLLMVSGMNRYYQIVRCFRDEDLRANRQPEFTQVDIEMSFVDVEDVIGINEKLIQKIFKEIKNVDITLPIRRMSYQEAMDKYGCDKPDLRFGFELENITDIFANSEFNAFKSTYDNGGKIKCVKIDGSADEFSKKGISKLEKFVKTYGAKGLAWFKYENNTFESPIAKFLTEEEINKLIERLEIKEKDVVFILADKESVVNTALGALRIEIAHDKNLIDNNKFELVWITEFPLFEYSEEEDRYVAKHHPFTAPVDEDIDKIESDPGAVRAKAYDIVINGDEIGGGSIRITNRTLQNRMFRALGFTDEEAQDKFGYLLEAFKYGVPPHGGIAYGLDRFMMLLTESDNIRDVIAFPKTQSASCLMTDSPSGVTDKQLKELEIEVTAE